MSSQRPRRAQQPLLRDCRLHNGYRPSLENEASILYMGDQVYFKTYSVRSPALRGKAAVSDLTCSCVWTDLDVPEIQNLQNLSKDFENTEPRSQASYQLSPPSTAPTERDRTISRVRFGGELSSPLNDTRGMVDEDGYDLGMSPRKRPLPSDALGVVLGFPATSPDLIRVERVPFPHQVLGFAVPERDAYIKLHAYIATSFTTVTLALLLSAGSFMTGSFPFGVALLLVSITALIMDLTAYALRHYSLLGSAICFHSLLSFVAITVFVQCLFGYKSAYKYVLASIAVLCTISLVTHLVMIGYVSQFLNTDNDRHIWLEPDEPLYHISQLLRAPKDHTVSRRSEAAGTS